MKSPNIYQFVLKLFLVVDIFDKLCRNAAHDRIRRHVFRSWEDQKNEGREEGRELGERQKIISQIVKKLQKDKSVAEIADDLEEKEEVIAPIYEAALSMKPDYDVEKIYELLEKNKKLA